MTTKIPSDVTDIVISPDGREIKFAMQDGSTRLIVSAHSVPGLRDGMPVETHINMALASALLTLQDRVDALERNQK